MRLSAVRYPPQSRGQLIPGVLRPPRLALQETVRRVAGCFAASGLQVALRAWGRHDPRSTHSPARPDPSQDCRFQPELFFEVLDAGRAGDGQRLFAAVAAKRGRSAEGWRRALRRSDLSRRGKARPTADWGRACAGVVL